MVTKSSCYRYRTFYRLPEKVSLHIPYQSHRYCCCGCRHCALWCGRIHDYLFIGRRQIFRGRKTSRRNSGTLSESEERIVTYLYTGVARYWDVVLRVGEDTAWPSVDTAAPTDVSWVSCRSPSLDWSEQQGPQFDSLSGQPRFAFFSS